MAADVRTESLGKVRHNSVSRETDKQSKKIPQIRDKGQKVRCKADGREAVTDTGKIGEELQVH